MVRLRKYTHACVRIEDSGSVLVIDPGELSEPEALDGVDAVLITHEHFDHLDVDKLADLLGKRPDVAIHTTPDVADRLSQFGDSVHRVETGDRFEAAGFSVLACGGLHAMIYPELPRVPNLGYFIEIDGAPGGVYHPGDSFDVPDGVEVETLFVPVSAPWLKLVEAVEFVKAIAPRRAFPLHDGLLNEVGNVVVTGGMTRFCPCDYERLLPGSEVAVPAARAAVGHAGA